MLVDLKKAEKSARIIRGARSYLRDDISLDKVEELIRNIQILLGEIHRTRQVKNWEILLRGLKLIKSNLLLLQIADTGEGDLIVEKERFKILKRSFKESSTNTFIELAYEEIFDENDDTYLNLSQIKEKLLGLDYPSLSIVQKEKKSIKQFPSNDKEVDRSVLPLVKLIAFIDKSPHVAPQIIQPAVNYDVRINLEGLNWPDDAQELKLDFLTTYQKDEYSISNLELKKPKLGKDNRYKAELNGNIIFRSEQGVLSEKISFKTRAAFIHGNGKEKEVKVVGHTELNFRVLSKKSLSFGSGYSVLDSHIYDLVVEMTESNPTINAEIEDLLEILLSLNNLLGKYEQGAVFKKTKQIVEADFQNRIRDDLRSHLGKDVEEHRKQGGGFTDLVYKGIVVELKVEKKNGDRRYLLEKYIGQSVQYQGVEAKQVSIVVVLDITEKNKPIGDLRNNVLTTNVETHGGGDDEKKYPSKAFLFVIDGNTKNPSDYSK